MDKTMDTAPDLEPSSRLENQRFVRFGPTFLKTIALSYFFFYNFLWVCKENGAKEPVYLQCPFGVQRHKPYEVAEGRVCQNIL